MTNTNNENVPWTEKYRATNLEDIVLDPINKKILYNIIETSYFPNLLFYGPPGTGKTTTIINLIKKYQEKHGQQSKELMIHLNASDERGIDIIRIQISQFVNSKTLFRKGMKFVILDEVDYMTKNAQQALRYLIQNYSENVRFCLICNYVSRIDEGLQNELLRLRFNQLPQEIIIPFLKRISTVENLPFQDSTLNKIQQLFDSDIRSMVNFMQTNQENVSIQIVDSSFWEELFHKMKENETTNECILSFLQKTSKIYNMHQKSIIKDFLNYIIRNKIEHVNSLSPFLSFVENIMHYQDCKTSLYTNYAISRIRTFLIS